MTNFTQDYSIYIAYPVCYNYCEDAAEFILPRKKNEQGAAK